jgi:hypothetical protein
MNKIFTFSILLIIILSGCTVNQEINNTITNISQQINDDLNQGINDTINDFVSNIIDKNESELIINPISNFSIKEINYLNITCQGTNLEIANCIKEWQGNNMIYLGLTEISSTYPDAADSIHWNYAIPGVFPTIEVIKERSEGNKPYGVCYDYATIYCSIANYYELTCRVSNSLIKPSQRPDSQVEFTTGLQYSEYERMKVELNKQEIDYDFILMNKVLRETPEHYWAEVLIDTEWLVMDGSNTAVQTRYKDANDWQVTNWTKNYIESNIEEYINTIDDLGERVRIFDNGDYMFSEENNLELTVPYFETCEDSCPFFKGSLTVDCVPDCNSYKSAFECYESCSGNNYYIICDYICGQIEDVAEANSCYKTCSGKDINMACDEQCLND